MSEGLGQPEKPPTIGFTIETAGERSTPGHGLREGGTTLSSLEAGVSSSAEIPAEDPSALVPSISNPSAAVDNLNWDLGHYEGGEDKNPFGDISEEQMNKLDEVLSLDEVQKFLQQSGKVDTEPLKLDAFDLDDLATHEIIKKGLREQDVAKIAVSFSDHAYALAPQKEARPTPLMASPTPLMASSPATVRKSSRIAKRKGENTEDESTEDSEGTGKEEVRSDEKDEETKESEDEKDKTKESEDEKDKTKGRGKGKKGKKETPDAPRATRRSTRISEHEQREMAEKIRQENIRKEKEDMEAMMKAKEEERLEAERQDTERQETERQETERQETERQETERLEAERQETERLEAERQETERLETERQETEKLAKEKEEEEKCLQAKKDVVKEVKKGVAKKGKKGVVKEGKKGVVKEGKKGVVKEGKKEGTKGVLKKGGKGVVMEGEKEVMMGRGRGRGRGKRKAGINEGKPGTLKEYPKRSGRGRGRGGKKTDDSVSQESSTEDDVPLKKLAKTPKQSKQKQVKKLVGSDAEEDVPLQKVKAEMNKTKPDEKPTEKKTSEDSKPKSISLRHRKSSGRKSESELKVLESMSDLFKPDGVIVHQQEELKGKSTVASEAGCQADDENDDQLSNGDGENDSDWDPGDDPNKLWCICKKPHGNRFMICCDQCQGWFHGKCVGITRERGKEMEKRNEEYVCPECTVKDKWKDSKDDVETGTKGGATSGRKADPSDKPAHDERDRKKRTSLSKDRKKRPESLDVEVKKEQPEKSGTVDQDEATSSSGKDDLKSPTKESSHTSKFSEVKVKGHSSAEDSSTSESRDKITDVEVKGERSFLSVLSDISKEPDSGNVKSESHENSDLKGKEERDCEKSAPVEKKRHPSGNPRSREEKRRDSKKSASEDDTKMDSEKSVITEEKRRDSHESGEKSTPHREQTQTEAKKSSDSSEQDKDVQKATPKTEKRRDYGEKIEKTLEEIRKRRLEISEQEKKKKRFKGLGDHKRTFEKCIVEKCPNESQPESVYCSNQCIVKYAEDSIKIIRREREKSLGFKRSPDKKVAIKVVVMERRTGRVLTGPSAPSEGNLHEWLKLHPTFEVLRPAHSSHKISSSFYKKEKEEKEKKESKHLSSAHSTPTSSSSSSLQHHSSSQHHSKSPEDSGPGPVRLNVRKSLRDVLAYRANEADDMMLSNNEIKKLALAIEEELFGLFHETGSKYKSKYRSLIFNIKDSKNKGLFRKILSGQIKPTRLVRMTPDELASKDLAKWREMENKHSLEIIELAEKEAQEDAGKKHVTKKTHKGEQEVADEDLSSLIDVASEKDKPGAVLSPVTPTVIPGDILSGLIFDTTEQHKMHLFDLNCKVCTGKVAPPCAEEPPPKKVKVARTVSRESQEGYSQDKKEEPMEKAEEEKEVKEVMKVIEKVKAEDEMAASSAADSTSIIVRSPDSALQSGLDVKPKSQPGVPALWKGFIHMQDTARFITSAHRVSGPTHYLTMPDTVLLCGRIAPEQVWDYLARVKKSGSKDICIIRFEPAAGEEKTAYIQLYSYLNSRSRCGVGGNNTKFIKDMYIVPLASHSKIPSILLPFDGPGLQDNRPHMLLGVVVKLKLKRNTSESALPESQPVVAPADGPTQVKRFKQPTAAMTPPRRSPADPRKHPLDPRERPKGGAFSQGGPAKMLSPLAVKKSSPAHERSYTPPLELMPSRSSPKRVEPISREQDPIVKEYGDVDLQKVEAEEREKASGQEAEDEKPYDPEDMEDIGAATVESKAASADSAPPEPQPGNLNIIQMADQIAGSENPAEVTADMFTALSASSKLKDQKTLLVEMTRRVEEQKRQIEQKKLAAGLDAAGQSHIPPSLSTLLTALKSTGLTTTIASQIASGSIAPAVSTSTPAATTTATGPHPSAAANLDEKEKLWEHVIKANIGVVPTQTETPAAVPPPEKVPPVSKPKEEDMGNASSKSEESKKDVSQPGKKSDDSKTESRQARTPDKESSKGKSEPERKGSRRSPDRSRRTGESSRRSRTPEKKASSDSSKKSSSSRHRSRSPDRKERDSRRESSSRSSSHRSGSGSDRRRSDSDSRRSSHKERDSGRSRHERDSSKSSPRRDERSRQASRSSRSSSKEEQKKGSDSSSAKSGDPKDKRKEEDSDKGKKSGSETEPKTTGLYGEPSREIASATSTNKEAKFIPIPEVMDTATGSSSEPISKSVKPAIPKTESEILDELVLGKREDRQPTIAAGDDKKEEKDEAMLAEEANLPVIPGFGFNTIPMSELTDILKRVGSSTSGSATTVTTTATADSSSAVETVSATADPLSIAGTTSAAAESSSTVWTTATTTTADSPSTAWSTSTTIRTSVPAAKPATLPSLFDLPLVRPPGFPFKSHSLDKKELKQGKSENSSQEPSNQKAEAVMENKGDVDYRTNPRFTNVASPSDVFSLSQGAPPKLPLGTSTAPVNTEQSKPVHKDVDLRRGDSMQQAASVFLGTSDSDMRVKPKDGDTRLGSGDSDMRIAASDSDMRMGASDSDMRMGGGDRDMRVRPSGPPVGGKSNPPVPFHGKGQGEGRVFQDTDNRREHGGPAGIPPHMRGDVHGGKSSPVPMKQDVPMCPPPLPPPMLPQRVFIGDKDERQVPVLAMGRAPQDGGQQGQGGQQILRQPPDHKDLGKIEGQGQSMMTAPPMPPPFLQGRVSLQTPQQPPNESSPAFPHVGPRPPGTPVTNISLFQPDANREHTQAMGMVHGQRPLMNPPNVPRFMARMRGGHSGRGFPRLPGPAMRMPLSHKPPVAEGAESHSAPKVAGDLSGEQPSMKSVKSVEQRENSPGRKLADSGKDVAHAGKVGDQIQSVSQAPGTHPPSTSQPPNSSGVPCIPVSSSAIPKSEPPVAAPPGTQGTSTIATRKNKSAEIDFTEDLPLSGESVFSPRRDSGPSGNVLAGRAETHGHQGPRFAGPTDMPPRGMAPLRGPRLGREQDRSHNVRFDSPQRLPPPPMSGRGMMGPRGPRPFYPRHPRGRGRGRGW